MRAGSSLCLGKNNIISSLKWDFKIDFQSLWLLSKQELFGLTTCTQIFTQSTYTNLKLSESSYIGVEWSDRRAESGRACHRQKPSDGDRADCFYLLVLERWTCSDLGLLLWPSEHLWLSGSVLCPLPKQITKAMSRYDLSVTIRSFITCEDN